MPKVGNKKFDYTSEGVEQAKNESRATGEPVDYSPGGTKDASQRSSSMEGYATGGTVELPPLGPGVRWNFNQGPDNAIEVPDTDGRTDEVTGEPPLVGPGTIRPLPPGKKRKHGFGREEDNWGGGHDIDPQPRDLPKQEWSPPPSPVPPKESYEHGGQVKKAGEPQGFTKGAATMRERGKKLYKGGKTNYKKGGREGLVVMNQQHQIPEPPSPTPKGKEKVVGFKKGGKPKERKFADYKADHPDSVGGAESVSRQHATSKLKDAGLKKPKWWHSVDADVREAWLKDRKRSGGK